MPVKKDHYIYCPGGDCTCPPMPQTQKVDVKKVLKSLDSMNKAKPCPVTMPVVKPKPKVAIPKITKKVIDPEEQERKKGLIRSKNAAKLMTVVVDARTNAIVLKKAANNMKPKNKSPIIREKLDSCGEPIEVEEKSEDQIRKEAELAETLKVVEEGRCKLSQHGLILDEEVNDEELEDLWQKDILSVFAANKAAKKFKKKNKTPKVGKEENGNKTDVKSSLQLLEDKMKNAHLHEF